jgi:creatinase
MDVGVDTARQRMFKSDEEIEIIKLGAATADIGGEACKMAMKEGVEEWEVAKEGVAAMVKNISDKVGDRSELLDTWVWLQSGLNTDGAHNPLTNRKLRNGDILSLNCFPMIQGYYTALERTMFLGHVDPASLKYWEANVAVHERGLELIKPGAKCSEIAAELNDLFQSFGLLKYRSFGYGHSFGVLSHYYGREAGLELREDIETVIEVEIGS